MLRKRLVPKVVKDLQRISGGYFLNEFLVSIHLHNLKLRCKLFACKLCHIDDELGMAHLINNNPHSSANDQTGCN